MGLIEEIISPHDAIINGNIFRVTDPVCGEFTGHR